MYTPGNTSTKKNTDFNVELTLIHSLLISECPILHVGTTSNHQTSRISNQER